MKNPASEFPRRYLAALRTHLDGRGQGGAVLARSLGREVLAAGFDILDLARMHEQALVALAPSQGTGKARHGVIRRARGFFTETFTVAEKSRLRAPVMFQRLQQRTETLRRRTAAEKQANRQLKREVERRKAGEAAVKQGKEHYRQLFVQSQFMQKKLRHLARKILSAQEDERRVISRELHDEVVQTLVGINVQLAALGTAAKLGVRALKLKIAHTQRLVEKSVSAVHQFARELRPAALDDLGLIPALHAYMKIVAAREKIKINLTTFAGVESLDKAKRTVLYRVAQEALTNVGRHAEASVVNVSVRHISAAVVMEVQDNGKSFDVPQTLSARTNRRLGLLGMRERVEMVGGVLTIESSPGRGTMVRAEIPFRAGGKS